MITDTYGGKVFEDTGIVVYVYYDDPNCDRYDLCFITNNEVDAIDWVNKFNHLVQKRSEFIYDRMSNNKSIFDLYKYN